MARALSPGELAVARHLLVHGPATRGDLGDRLNLSYASTSRAARALIQEGMASEVLEQDSAVGRPRQVLAAVPTARHVLGCKLTADTAYAVVCDMFGGISAAGRAALPAPDASGAVPVAGVVKVIAQLSARLARRVPSLDGIGVAVGGIVTERSTVREGTFLGWRDVDLAGPVSKRTGLPVTVTNDVTALAREQLWFGAGRTHSTFGVITVGAGLGFGVVREGVAVEELIDNGHLLAHSPVDPSGPACGIGHRGCTAAYLNRQDIERHAGRGFDELVRAASSSAVSSSSAAASSSSFSSGGDPEATRLLDQAARALGHLVATFAGALQTTCIVLAGEDVAALTGTGVMDAVIAERLRPGADEAQRCALGIITTPLTFNDWAQGAAVAGIQNILGAA